MKKKTEEAARNIAMVASNAKAANAKAALDNVQNALIALDNASEIMKNIREYNKLTEGVLDKAKEHYKAAELFTKESIHEPYMKTIRDKVNNANIYVQEAAKSKLDAENAVKSANAYYNEIGTLYSNTLTEWGDVKNIV